MNYKQKAQQRLELAATLPKRSIDGRTFQSSTWCSVEQHQNCTGQFIWGPVEWLCGCPCHDGPCDCKDDACEECNP